MSALEGSSQIGPMFVYREFIPRKDVVEVTTFFRRGGKKWRIDLETTSEDLEKLNSVPGDARRYVQWRTEKAAREGDYRDATVAISPSL